MNINYFFTTKLIRIMCVMFACLSLSTLTVSAGTACQNSPAVINWSWDSNAQSIAKSVSRPECDFTPSFTPSVAGGGSKNITIPGGTPSGTFCTATITAQPGDVISSDTLTYDATKVWDTNTQTCVTPAGPPPESPVVTVAWDGLSYGASINAGNSSTLSWSSTNGPNTCSVTYTGTSNMSGTIGGYTNPSTSFSAGPFTTGTVIATVTCVNNASGRTGSSASTLTVACAANWQAITPSCSLWAGTNFTSYGVTGSPYNNIPLANTVGMFSVEQDQNMCGTGAFPGTPSNYRNVNTSGCTAPATSYTYTFNSNSGTGMSPASRSGIEGSALSGPTTPPTLSGYTLTGWTPPIPTTMPNGGGASTAQWAPIPTATLDAFSSATIAQGQSATISFSSTDATACFGTTGSLWEGNLGGTSATNRSTGAMNTPGTYTQTIYCTGPGGTSANSIQRTIIVNAPLPTITLDAFSPSTITQGQSATVSFSSTNATVCYGTTGSLWTGNLGGTSVTGQSTGAMNTPGTYTQTIYCTGPGGTSVDSAQQTLIVNAAGSPTGTLTSTPSSCTIANGASTCNSSFTWTTTNPVGISQVVGDGGGPFSTSINNNTQSLAVRYINGSTGHIFKLYNNSLELAQTSVVADCASSSAWNGSTCQACANGGCTNHICNNGANNPPTCTPAPTIVSFTSSPTSITSGNSSTLTWTTTGATSCSLNQGIGSVPVNSSTGTGALVATRSYTLTCTSTGGLTSTANVTVTVAGSPAVNCPSGSTGRAYWGNCGYDSAVTGTSDGQTTTGSNQLANYTGSATLTCNTNTGTWSVSSPTCSASAIPNCTNQSVTGGGCTGMTGTTANAGSATVSAQSGYTGSATFSCNGSTNTYSYSSGSCTLTPVPQGSCPTACDFAGSAAVAASPGTWTHTSGDYTIDFSGHASPVSENRFFLSTNPLNTNPPTSSTDSYIEYQELFSSGQYYTIAVMFRATGYSAGTAACPATESCVPNIDCDGTWSAGTCSVSGACGQNGTLWQSFTQTTAQSGTGAACPSSPRNGGACSTAACPAASFSSTPSCTIANGASSCTATASWTSANTANVTLADCSPGAYVTRGTGAQSYSPLTIPYSSGCYRIYDGATTAGTILTQVTGTADCSSSSAWNGSTCQACSNGGCGPTPHVCTNGANNAPTCTPPPVISTFSASPSTIAQNDASTLTWTSSGASTCTIDNGIGNVPVNGSIGTGPIPSTRTYTITCTSPVGGLSSQRTTTVTVVNPQVSTFTLSDNNTPLGVFSMTCTGSLRYDILKDGVSVYGGSQPYTVPVTRNVTVSGNYVGVCINGPVERYSAGVYYDKDPLRPIISLVTSPRSIPKNAPSTLTWNILHASIAPETLCSISAKAICTNNVCTAEQTATQNAVRSMLTGSSTDQGGSITSSIRGTGVLNANTSGAKTFSKLGNSMEFTVTCGHIAGPVSTTARVLVTESNER